MRQVVNAIPYLNRSGNAWRMLPRNFGLWSSVCHDCTSFRVGGTWQRIHGALRAKVRRQAGSSPRWSARWACNQSSPTLCEKRDLRL